MSNTAMSHRTTTDDEQQGINTHTSSADDDPTLMISIITTDDTRKYSRNIFSQSKLKKIGRVLGKLPNNFKIKILNG